MSCKSLRTSYQSTHPLTPTRPLTHHTWFLWHWAWDMELCGKCLASALPSVPTPPADPSPYVALELRDPPASAVLFGKSR